MEYVKLEIRNEVAWVTIDRQSKLNALNTDVLDELSGVFSALDQEEAVRVIVVTGAGPKSFVAGADISQFPKMTPEDALAFARHGQKVFSQVEACSRPVIAAVNGFALGGGCELAMACHIRFAADNAVFGQPEVKLGVIAGYGGTQRLQRLVGTGRALDLLLSGRMVKTDEALDIGLVNAVHSQSDLMAEVEKYTEILKEQGGLAQAATLEAVYAGASQPLADALETEAQAFRKVFDTEDRIEGATAFLERRAPEFKNK